MVERSCRKGPHLGHPNAGDGNLSYLYAWGDNAYGELGDGTSIAKNQPIQIGGAGNWASIAAGSSSCGIKSDGTLWTWGYNNYGHFGQGNTAYLNVTSQMGTQTN